MEIVEKHKFDMSTRVTEQNLSFITSLNDQSSALCEQGIKVLKLSGGDPSHAPDELRQLIVDIGHDNKATILNYSPIAGFDKLRYALSSIIANRYQSNYSLKNILVCSGACSGLYLTLKTLLNYNDRVLIQDPCWEYLPRLIENCNGVPVRLNFFSSKNDNWEDLLIEIEMHINTGIKVLVINSPLNPSGKIIPIFILNLIIKLCHRYNVWLITDDVTIDFNYQYQTKEKIQNIENTISVNSFSKNLGITGLRFGYVAGPEEFINQLKKSQLYTFMYPNSFIQELMLRYLSLGQNQYYDFVDRTVSHYKNNALYFMDAFKTIPQLEIEFPDGGLFLFPKVVGKVKLDFKLLLNEFNVVVAPGEAFSSKCKMHFRVFLGTTHDAIDETVRKIKQFFTFHSEI